MSHHHHHHGHHHHHHTEKPAASPCHDCACSLASHSPADEAIPPSGGRGKIFHIPTMDCPVEENEIREALSGIAGIHSLYFHLASRNLSIDATAEAMEKALAAIRDAGFSPVPIDSGGRDIHEPGGHGRYWRLGLALFIAAGVEVLHFVSPVTAFFQGLIIILAIAAIALSGVSTYINGIRALMRGRLNINALMAVAVTGACLINQWPEAAMVMTLFAIAEFIEARSIDRARNAIHRLLNITPEETERQGEDKAWQVVPVAEIIPGQLIRVKPGERISLDGEVVSGHSTVNQMAITGESLPVPRKAGDTVFAGTINETGILEIRVTARFGQTMLARIIEAVEKAQESKAPLQRFIDRFAAFYTPVVFLIALAVAVFMPFILGWTWMDSVYRALVLLVIACPCALVIATPLTVVSGLAAAARAGILIKGGIYLEQARKIKAVAFDKTGTITEGKPRLVVFESVMEDISHEQQEKIKQWAATLAGLSSHPVSQAIFAALETKPLPVQGYTESAGMGSEADIDDEHFFLGNLRMMQKKGLLTPDVSTRLEAHEKAGYTVTMLATPAGVLAFFGVADTIRTTSRDTLAALKSRNIATVMLTGDNKLTAEAIALQAGITDVRSSLLPEDKLVAINQLEEQYGFIAMVGDGINDAPALASADIGIAMGEAGTDIAMETADVVIMNDDPGRIVDLIRLSGSTYRILQENIFIALGIKLVFFILALAGHATMWMAVFADVGATLIVVFNGLRLLRWRSRLSAK